MLNLGPYVEHGYRVSEFECAYCPRLFQTISALQQHCQFSSSHAWCSRCERVFPNDNAMQQHVDNSAAHNICFSCCARWDFPSQEALTRHREEHHPTCFVCGQGFKNDNDLRMHMRRHLPRDLECYGCSRDFPSFSAMLIHLEAGNCDGGADRRRINDLAFQCYQNKKYSTSPRDRYPFYCPSCDNDFTTLSGLFQHAETRPNCDSWLAQPRCLAKVHHYVRWKVHKDALESGIEC